MTLNYDNVIIFSSNKLINKKENMIIETIKSNKLTIRLIETLDLLDNKIFLEINGVKSEYSTLEQARAFAQILIK